MSVLGHPIENFVWKTNISQLFGVNRTYYKDNFDIPGHNAIDVIVRDNKNGYGAKVLAAHDGIIYSTESDFPSKTRGNGIRLRSLVPLIGENAIETIYWHLSDFVLPAGKIVKKGDVIGLMGNTGAVSPKPSQDKPWDGTHLHFGYALLNQLGGIIDLNDGYRGYRDPTPLMYTQGDRLPMYFHNDLFFGSEGDSVAWLQTCLAIDLGLEKVTYAPLGYFGAKTLANVIQFQNKYSLTPSVGYVGPKTRHKLHELFSSFYTV